MILLKDFLKCLMKLLEINSIINSFNIEKESTQLS